MNENAGLSAVIFEKRGRQQDAGKAAFWDWFVSPQANFPAGVTSHGVLESIKCRERMYVCPHREPY